MKSVLLLALLITSVLPAIASTKTLTVLGNQKIKTQWDGKMPKAMSDQGIETNVTGIIISGGKLVPTFGFDCSNERKLLKVLVEDVTGKEAHLLVEDLAPVIVSAHWKGNGTPYKITPEGVPWLYRKGDTLTVFRFTVFVEGNAQPVIIYQPSVIPEATKVQLRNITAMLKG